MQVSNLNVNTAKSGDVTPPPLRFNYWAKWGS